MARPYKGSVGQAVWTDSFDGASLNPAYITSNSVGTVVDTNSGAGSLRIATTGTAIKGYLDWGRASLYLPGLLNFDLTCDFSLIGSVEQYLDISFRADNGTATGAPDVTGNGYSLEIGGVNAGSWFNETNSSTLSGSVVTESTTPQPGNGTLEKLHIVAYDDQIKERRWTSGSAGEPDAWQLTYVDRKHYLATGRPYFIVGLLGGANNGCSATFDNLVISRLNLGRLWSNRRGLYYPTTTTINAGNASTTITAFDQTAGSRTQTQPTVALSANALSSPRTITQAALTVIANNASILSPRTLGSATVPFTAFDLSSPRTQTAANIGFAAFDQTATSPVTITAQTANMSFTANSLGLLSALGSASIGFSANAVSSPRAITSALIALSASDESVTSNKALGLASFSFTANNESLLTQYALGLASLSFTANNVSSSRALSVASMAIVANVVSSPRQSNVASFNLTAYNESRTLIQALGSASISFTAFNASLTQISNLPLGLASFSLAALDLTPLILRSAGFAVVGLTAGTLSPMRPAGEPVAALTTAAFPVSLGSGRNAGLATLDLNAFDVALLTSYSEESASVAFGAFNVSLTLPIVTRIKYTIKGVVKNLSIDGFLVNRNIDGTITNNTIDGDVSQ